MKLRLGVVAAGAVVSLVVVLFVSSAISAAPVVKPRPTKSGHHAPVAVAAGGFDKVNGNLSGHVTNLTPYTWTLAQESKSPYGTWPGPSLPATVKPTEGFDYQTHAWAGSGYHVCCETDWFFNSWVTYRADTPRGTEYLTMWVTGCWTEGLANCGAFIKSTLSVNLYNTTAPPYKNMMPPTPDTSNPAIGWSQSSDFGSDVLFEVQGNYTIDAAKSPPGLDGVLNLLCAGSDGTSCSFTSSGPLVWSIGEPTSYGIEPNCSQNPSNGPPLPSSSVAVAIKQSRDASISVGGSITAGADFKVLTVVEVEVTAKFGIEHEWSDRSEYDKKVTIFVPAGWVGQVWSAPVQGTVTGTLKLSTALANYTVTNFTETKKGVSPDLRTPPVDIMTYARPMTEAEIKSHCQSTISSPAPSGGLG
jgi:hypothetical protein